MNLFELFVKIGVDDQASKGIKDAANEAEKSTSSFSKLASSVGKGLATAAKVGAAALGVAASGITALVTASVKQYAEYEQLVGGVETLFKKSADKVQEYAANAYKTAGLSANEYMSTVTSFSASLLQSLGGDTDKAAEYANQAITDMSDNANKMGTDMSLIQNAYQGFAKANYTMLDNLKLGYGGTKEEMQRLVADAAAVDKSVDANSLSFANIVKAINVVQTELGITGTTALEASKTISGSVGAMKSAWKNLLTGITDDNAQFDVLVNNFVESVATVGENIMPRVEVALDGVLKLIEGLAPQIINALPKFVNEFLPKLINAATGIIKSLLSAIKKNAKTIAKTLKNIILDLVDAVLDMIPDFIDAVVELFGGIVDAIPDVIVMIVKELPKIIEAIVKGLLKGAAAVGQAVLKLFDPRTWKFSDLRREIERTVDSISPFQDAINKTRENAVDLSKYLSDSGKTMDELEQKIDEVENKITEIIKKELEEQDGYRQKDLENIRKYMNELDKLNEERLGIARSQQRAEFLKISSFEGTLSQEEAAEYIGKAGALLDAANKIADEAYTQNLTIIENKHKASGTIGSKQYQQEIKDARKQYEADIAENEKYYSDALASIMGKAVEFSGIDTKEIKKIVGDVEKVKKGYNSTVADYYEATDGASFFGYLGALVSDPMRMLSYSSALRSSDEQFVEQISKLAKHADSLNAYFTYLSTLTSAGGSLDQNTKEAVNNILGAFTNAPPLVEEDGKNILLGIVRGMEETMPELKSASEMSVQAIVDTIRKGLEIRSPSRVMAELGAYSAEGFGQGWTKEMDGVLDSMGDDMSFEVEKYGGNEYDSYYGAGQTSFNGLTININGANYSDENALAEAIAERLQMMTERAGAAIG